MTAAEFLDVNLECPECGSYKQFENMDDGWYECDQCKTQWKPMKGVYGWASSEEMYDM